MLRQSWEAEWQNEKELVEKFVLGVIGDMEAGLLFALPFGMLGQNAHSLRLWEKLDCAFATLFRCVVRLNMGLGQGYQL